VWLWDRKCARSGTCERRSTAIAGYQRDSHTGTDQTEQAGELSALENHLRRNARASQAAMAFSRKQCPSRSNRNGSLRRSRRAMGGCGARRWCFLGSAAKRGSVSSGCDSNSWPRTGRASTAISIATGAEAFKQNGRDFFDDDDRRFGETLGKGCKHWGKKIWSDGRDHSRQ